MKKYGFTLAEVLITLGIIGVVAAITLPALINNFKKMAYVNQLRVGYNIANEGFARMLAKEGVTDWEYTDLYRAVEENGGNTDKVAVETAVRPILEKYFQDAVFISRQDLRKESSCDKLVGTGVRFWNLSDKTQCSGNYNMQYVLPNGMYMNFYFMAPCTASSYSVDEIRANGGIMTRWCGAVWLDINGKKGPNQWGRDGYYFMITQEGKVVPYQGKDRQGGNLIRSTAASPGRGQWIHPALLRFPHA